jgi:hypothetical protein
MDRSGRASRPAGASAWPLLLLLVALLVRGITPAGWMPNPQGLAGSPFVICTADGAHVVTLDHDGQPTKPASSERHDLCAFAGHNAAPAAHALLHLGSSHVELLATAQPAPAASPLCAPRHRDQAPRAPPTFV